MELRSLNRFVVVAEELHFGRAAKRMHVAESAISRQIKRLEEELELDLFDRTNRRVQLTPAGGWCFSITPVLWPLPSMRQ